MVGKDLKVLGLLQQDHFVKTNLQFNATNAWGGGTTPVTAPNKFPVEGSINWGNRNGEAVKQGGTLPQQGNATQTQASTPSQVEPQGQPGQSHQQ